MKESIALVASEVIEATIPRARYGTVTAVETASRRVTVTYPDEGTSVSLPGNTILPGIGAVVRVSGYQGGRYIDDVVSGPVIATGNVQVMGGLTAGALVASSGVFASTVNASAFLGSGASLTGLSTSQLTSGTLPLARGGTGGTDAASARTGIGLTSMSSAVVASNLVQRDASGYIFANYINMTAGIPGGNPTYLAGQNGDGYLRYYNSIPASWISGSLPSGALNSGNYSCNTLYAGSYITTGGYIVGSYLGGTGNTTGGITGGSGAVLRDDSGDNFVHMDWNGSALLFYVDSTFIFYATPGSILNSAGTKTFVIQHPSNEDRYLVHACAEGPTTDVFYRGRAKCGGNGLAVVELPDYFEDLTTEDRTIQLTGIRGPSPWVETEIVGNSFIVKGQPDQEFFWRVDAERKGATFNVEPLKSESVVEGFGPYRFLR